MNKLCMKSLRKLSPLFGLLWLVTASYPLLAQSVKVMSFNIRFDNPADENNCWENRRKLATLTIRNVAPDFIGMQEALERQVLYLDASLPGYDYIGVGRDDGKKAGEYVPVFYRTDRFTLLDQGHFWLSETPGDTGSVGWDAALPRICTWGKFRETETGREILFLNTHFDHMGAKARAESARLILGFIGENMHTLPVILTGDFNCSADEEPYRILTQGTGLSDACLASGDTNKCSEGTFNGFGHEQNPQRIDFIFFNEQFRTRSYEARKITYNGMFVSDHWPVLAQLECSEKGARPAERSGEGPAGRGQGDTTIVQTFTFDSIVTRRAEFQFPGKEKRYEKILMYYTLKCDSLTPHDQYPCGEWDYTTYVKVFVPTGRYDSLFYTRTDSLGNVVRSWFGESIEVREPFEIGRFITPYGKRLDLGLNGFTWIYDVTDYEPLLHGTVDLKAGNGQELLDLRFLFIEGIPPRDVVSVRNIWPEGSYTYKELADDAKLQTVRQKLADNASTFSIRARISGHGHFGPFNCCEWDPKTHTYLVNGENRFDWKVWRDCGMNPVHPQGGTWQFDRAGWCPGTFVDTYDFEITPFVEPGEEVSIDYLIQPYDTANGEEGGNFEMAMHLIEYSSPNYKLDLELTDILAPGNRHEYRRMNPVSLNPVIRIRSLGTDTVRNITFFYGLEKGEKITYDWQGKLGFMQSADIILPKPSWQGADDKSMFIAEIITVNGLQDERESNNTQVSAIVKPVILPDKFIIHVKTQGFGRAADNAWKIKDETGRVVYERLDFLDDTVYDDPVSLPPGAYDFTFTDKNEDGLIRHWWLHWEDPGKVGQNGELKILGSDEKEIMNLGYDFAEKRTLQFFVGEPE